ncbi:MAG: polysaccharide biosynthesis tyrosine autokinase [Eubacteriales bacterium]|nr:polysaccharide biosynthesis tyrosine autokinase [Eubacteriales bacterium]
MDSIMKDGTSSKTIHFDWYTMIKDVLKEWSIILMISFAAMLFSYSAQYLRYQPTYTMKATFTVNSRTATTDIYSNLSNASATASAFENVLNSDLMKNKVGQALGFSTMPGKATAERVEDTNLLEITVTENSPKLAHDVYIAIMNNYYDIVKTMIGEVVLNELLPPEIPTKSNKEFTPQKGMIQSFFIGMVGSIIFLGFLSFLKDTVRREEDVEEKLDAKMLGILKHEKKYKKMMKKKEKRAILMSDPMVSFRYSESMKKIGSKISTKMGRRHAKTVLVTSVMENEGKSTVAANIALALSKRSNKVLLLDGDFRKPALFKIFDMDPEEIENFGEVLNGKADIHNLICTKDNLNLSFILNSVRYPDSTDMISQDLMTKVIGILENQFDYIVIDSSPMALAADTQEWMEIIDTAVLVVRQNIASVRDINDCIARLNRNGRKLLGVVFNNVKTFNDRNTISRYRVYGESSQINPNQNYNKYSYDFKNSEDDYLQYADYSKKESKEYISVYSGNHEKGDE